LFKSQENWAFTPDYLQVLKSIAKLGGIAEDKFESCLTNKANEEKILQTKKDAIDVLEVSSTPTIFINGIVYEGKHSHQKVAKYIDSLMKPSSN
jgi:protein-disulfide isomerase